jgi:hypothetical protein
MRSRIRRSGLGITIAAVAGIAALGLQGCADAASPLAPSAKVVETAAVPMRTVLESQNSQVQTPRRLVIRSEAAWEEVWAELQGQGASSATRPEVDFRKEIVLLAALGTKPNAGYTVSLGPTVQVGDVVTATVRKVMPGARCGSADVVTHPFSIATIPATDLPVDFVEAEEVADCR